MLQLFKKFLNSISDRLPLSLSVKHSDGSVQNVGIGGPKVELCILNSKTYAGLLTNPSKAFGEGYGEGYITVPTNNLYELFKGIWTINASPKISDWREKARSFLYHFSTGNTIKKAKKNVEVHYDKFHRIVSLAVDSQTELYSCAFYATPGSTLAQAQINKADRILAKLDLAKGKKVLEIGCGYGYITRRAASQYGVEVTGVTPSEEQSQRARKLANEQNLNVKILKADYREVQGQFDAIYSIGMFEHVGEKHWLTYFRKLASMLNDKGMLLIHCETQKRPQKMDTFIDEFIFPGSQQPTPRQVLSVAEASGLRFHHAESWKTHYRDTLLDWAKTSPSERTKFSGFMKTKKKQIYFSDFGKYIYMDALLPML